MSRDASPSNLVAPVPLRGYGSRMSSWQDFQLCDPDAQSASSSHRQLPVPLPAKHPDSPDSQGTQQWDPIDDPLLSLPSQADLNGISYPNQNHNKTSPGRGYQYNFTRDPHNSSPSRRARISPDIEDQPPHRLREPPGPGATPLRSALRRKEGDHQKSVSYSPPASPVRRTSWPRHSPPSHGHTPWQRSTSAPQMQNSPCTCRHSPPHDRPHMPAPYPSKNDSFRSRHSWQRAPPEPTEPPIVPDFCNHPGMPNNSLNPSSNDGYYRRGPLQNIQQMTPIRYDAYSHNCPEVTPSARCSPYTPHPLTSVAAEYTAADDMIAQLLHIPADRVVWQTPRGELAWVPHPRPAPAASPQSFWESNFLGPSSINGGRQGLFNSQDAALLTGGNPLPGTAPYWTPGEWPPNAPLTNCRNHQVQVQVAPWIIPNPCNAYLPHLMWDVSQLPTTSKRITGNHIIMDADSIMTEVATHPPVDRLVVACNVGVAQSLWGLIEVKQSRSGGVRIWDVLHAIYEYFQMRVGRREVERISHALGDPEIYEKMTDAMFQRCMVTPALPGYEMKKGLKRIDCLGDATFFWGLYVTYNNDRTWQLNLGLVNRMRLA